MTNAYIIIFNMVKEPNICYLNHSLSMLRDPLICMLNLTNVIHVHKVHDKSTLCLLNLQPIVPVHNNFVFEIFRHISLISSLCTHTYVLGQYEKLVSTVAANRLISIWPLI